MLSRSEGGGGWGGGVGEKSLRAACTSRRVEVCAPLVQQERGSREHYNIGEWTLVATRAALYVRVCDPRYLEMYNRRYCAHAH